MKIEGGRMPDTEDYILERPFERIRRITGYLQKTGQWNNAKSAELKDRVKHGMER